MKDNGFVRVGALVNKLYLGNVIENAKEISKETEKKPKKETEQDITEDEKEAVIVEKTKGK